MWGEARVILLFWKMYEVMKMDFEMDEEMISAINKAKEFAEKYFTEELADKMDREEQFPMELLNYSNREGLMDYSNPWKILVTIEELCRKDPGLGISTTVPAFGSEVLMLYGSDMLKEKYLDPVLKGQKIMGLAVTEPGGGSDVASSKTEAKLEGDYYILNGAKMFITNGGIADYFVVLARTSPPPSPDKRHRGMSVFIVESKWEGFKANKIHGKMGVRATNTAELVFENVRVPKENLVGEEGKGFYYIMTFFNISRIYVAAQGLGVAQGILDRLMEHIKKYGPMNSQGEPIENIQFKLAEIATKIEASRGLTYKAASYLFKFNPNPVLTSMAKYYSGETAILASKVAMEIMGLKALNSELERFYRDARILEIWEGTSEIEKLIISRMMLKGGK